MVEEPDAELCKKILEGLKAKFEEHHRVIITDDAIDSAIQLSERYINDRHLPDKAIDVLDEACSKVSLRGYKVPENLEKMENMFQELKKINILPTLISGRRCSPLVSSKLMNYKPQYCRNLILMKCSV